MIHPFRLVPTIAFYIKRKYLKPMTQQNTKIIDIFVPNETIVPIEELLELTADENVAMMVDEAQTFLGYRAEWDAVTLEAWLLDDEKNAHAIRQLQSQTRTWLDKRTDKKARKVARRAKAMQMVYRLRITPDWDDTRDAQQLAQGIMAYYDYALFASPTAQSIPYEADGLIYDAVYNENGNREIGAEDSERKYWRQPDPEEHAPPEARERKARTIETLKREKVSLIDHLPVIPASHEVTLRTTEEALQRAIALWLIAERADGMSLDDYTQYAEQFGITEAITPDERSFADDDEPREDYVLEFSQRWESSLTLLWALNLVKHLDRAEIFVNPEFLRRSIRDTSYADLLARAEFRPVHELLDTLDLTYRYHWAVIDAELYGQNPPARLQPAILYERHYALNWLISYQDKAWDDVTTDT
jgi:hypothetical protein